MTKPIRFALLCCLTAALAAQADAQTNHPPTLHLLPMAGETPLVRPEVPFGKALILPMAASDEDGDQIVFSVASSNPKVQVRVKSGNPLLKFSIEHGTAGDTDYYKGDLVFQLFRDWTPETAEFIGGFAQSTYYENVLFHRLTDLMGDNDPNTPASFIYQGGDPLANDPDQAGRGGPSFQFDNEFHPALAFYGRGQLAMANSGFNLPGAGGSADYRGSNGSQFFITDGGLESSTGDKDGRPRHLDFNHTIFGQLLFAKDPTAEEDPEAEENPAWALMAKIRTTPVSASRPVKNLKIVATEVAPQYVVTTDETTMTYTGATLVFTSTTVGTSTITVTADDRKGGVVQHTFNVTVLPDTRNTPPFLMKMGDRTTLKGKQVNLNFERVDLERDFMTAGAELVQNGSSSNPNGFTGVLNANTVGVVGNTNYTGPLHLRTYVTQFEMDYRGDIDGAPRGQDVSRGLFVGDDVVASTIAVGERPIEWEPTTFEARPAEAMTDGVVARFRDLDPRGTPSDVTAEVCWGDGTTRVVDATKTPPELSGFFPATITRDGTMPGKTNFAVVATHTYAKAGIYRTKVLLKNNNGFRQELTGTAVVTSATFRAKGETLELPIRGVKDQIVATFKDTAPLPAANYAATIDWGDGAITNGVVKAKLGGQFTVVGRHTYEDRESYAVTVRIRKAGAPNEAIAWSTIKTKGVDPSRFPPYDQVHLIAEMSAAPVNPDNPQQGAKLVRNTVGQPSVNSQTHLIYQIVILNAGNKASKPGKLRFYLSEDKEVSPRSATNPNGDIPVKIGRMDEVPIPVLRAGAGVRYYLDKSKLGDFRLMLPPNETGSCYNLLGELVYSDPIADYQPIERAVVEGPYNPVIVKINGVETLNPIVQVREDGNNKTAKFRIMLDKPPKAPVTLRLTPSDGSEAYFPDGPRPVPTSAGSSFVAAIPKDIVFTPTDWQVEREVEIAGNFDDLVDGNQSFTVDSEFISEGDSLFDGVPGPTISGTNRDSLVAISPVLIETDETGSNSIKTFTVRLTRQPTSEEVRIPLSVSDPTEGSINKTELIFKRDANDALGWSKQQIVTITALDDADPRPEPTPGQTPVTTTEYKVILGPATSTDSEYNGLDPNDVTVRNKDK